MTNKKAGPTETRVRAALLRLWDASAEGESFSWPSDEVHDEVHRDGEGAVTTDSIRRVGQRVAKGKDANAIGKAGWSELDDGLSYTYERGVFRVRKREPKVVTAKTAIGALRELSGVPRGYRRVRAGMCGTRLERDPNATDGPPEPATKREPTIWKATLGPKAIEIIGNEDDGITIEGREVSGYAPAMAELVNRLLETKTPVGKRAAASIRKQVLELVTLVGTLNPELGFLMLADKRLICGEPPSPINTLALAKGLKDFEPTGVDMVTGEPRWRSFTSKQEWINKATSWMREGDVCFDADGVQLRIGKDFDGARYPVVIARPKR